MIEIFDWPWMTGVSVVAAIAMAWLVRASFRRRITRVSRLGTRPLVMRLVPESALRLPSGRSLRLGTAALLAGPWATGLTPTRHVYDATVWILVIWCALHVLTGFVMQAYSLARRAAGRMTGRYDVDMENTALFWHFIAFTVVVTVAVIAGFPLVTER